MLYVLDCSVAPKWFLPEDTATFYDALYVALAESRDCTVITADDGMSGAFGHLGRISLLRDLHGV